MKVSINSAQQYSNVDLKAISTSELVDKIGRQLGEVEEVTEWGPRFDGIVVAKVVSCEKHPNADKLSICRIDDGKTVQDVERGDDGLVQVVCGAPNVEAGLTVAWLPPGATVPSSLDKDPFVLEAREIRGQVSNGMLSSSNELGLSDDHSGILEIKAEEVGEELTKPGTSFKQLFNLDDAVIDIENKMFTHRPDCFGILGVARELAGIQGQTFVSPEWYLKSAELTPANTLPLEVKVEDFKLVPRFMAVALDNITVQPSPTWLQAGLTRVGIRPINNVVDITNFVMHLTGQPLHAYDYDKVKALSGEVPTLIARPGQDDSLALLNGKTVKVDAKSTVIATDKQAIGIGGVMGGADTEVDDNTKQIILECATFDMYNIRHTSTKFGLFTDAVTRFNKGQSPLQNPAVTGYAVELFQQLAGGKVASAVLDEHGDLPTQATVKISPNFINERLGSSLSSQDIATLLTNVEFAVSGDTELAITAPFWRTDIAMPEDIVEEVGRLYGYDNLPVVLPSRSTEPAPKNAQLDFKTTLRQILAAAGANEVLTYSFVHSKLIQGAGQSVDHAYGISNALSPDLQYYRLSLTPSLLDRAHPNIKAGYDEFALFEINKVHSKADGLNDEGVPQERTSLALIFASSDKRAAGRVGAPFYQARKYLDVLADKLGVNLSYAPLTKPSTDTEQSFQPGRAALVKSGEVTLGVVGEFQASVRRAFKLPNFVAGFELDLDALQAAAGQNSYEPISRFQWSEQDISLKLPSTTTFAEVASLVQKTTLASEKQHGYQATITPLDIYQAPEQSGSKHVTFRLRLSHPERTLKTEEVGKVLDAIAAAAKTQLLADRL